MLDDDSGSTAASAGSPRSEGDLGVIHQALAAIRADARMSDSAMSASAAFVELVTRSVEWEMDVREAATRIVEESRRLV